MAALKDVQSVENEPVFVKVSYVQFLMTAGKLILTHHVKNDQDILCLFFYNSVRSSCKVKGLYTEKFRFFKYLDFHYLSVGGIVCFPIESLGLQMKSLEQMSIMNVISTF